MKKFIPLRMWDPTLMYDWVRRVCKKEFNNTQVKFILERTGKALGVVYDYREKSVPDEPIWLKDSSGYKNCIQHGYRYGEDPYNPVYK